MSDFSLDPRLEKDSVPVAIFELCDLRLMRDRRWPWLLLIPRWPGATEIFELSTDDQAQLQREIVQVSKALKAVTGAVKINVGALGNIVRQLHVHVIARFEGDPNWPGPVWGHGTPEYYTEDDMHRFLSHLQEALSL